jgi:VanZ family protein
MVLLGIGIEVVQAKWIPERTGSALDFLADAVGIAVAVWIGRSVRSLVMSRTRQPV